MKLLHLILKRDSNQKWDSCFLPSCVWSLDIAVMKSLESQTEMYESDLRFRVLSELFPRVLDWGLVIVSIAEVFTCQSSHFPLVSHLSLSLNRHNQTQCLVQMKAENMVETTDLVWKKSPCYDAADASAMHSSAGGVWPLHPEAIDAILENTSVAREPLSSHAFPDAIPIFLGAVLQHESPATLGLTSGVQVALNEVWKIWHRGFMPKLKLQRELISLRVLFSELLSPSNKILNSHFPGWKVDEGFCNMSYCSKAFSRHCDTNSIDPLLNECTVFCDQGWVSQEED